VKHRGVRSIYRVLAKTHRGDSVRFREPVLDIREEADLSLASSLRGTKKRDVAPPATQISVEKHF